MKKWLSRMFHVERNLCVMAIPLESALLCANCDFLIPREATGKCGLCGSDAVLDVKTVLERNPTQVRLAELSSLLDNSLAG